MSVSTVSLDSKMRVTGIIDVTATATADAGGHLV